MKKYLIALSALTVMTVAANAQEKNNSTDASGRQHDTYMHHKKPGYGMHTHHHRNMMMKLNLTDAQKQQVKDLNTDYRNQLKDLEKSETITLKDYCAKKASLEQERKSKFQSILTSDQKSKIAQARKERSEKMKVMSEKRLEKMKTDLNLTDEQVAKIKEQRNNSIEQAKAIRQNPSLTQEQKKEQFISLMKSRKESMNSILTPEQIKKKEEMRNNRINDMKNKKTNKDS
jgi:Spy/CpxP family protein refolding chaperone